MSELVMQAALAFGDILNATLRLASPTTVIEAPPNEMASYPACALWIEHWRPKWMQNADLVVNADGEPMIGTLASITEQPAGPFTVAPGVTISKVGELRMTGRLWTGSRLPDQRAEMGGKILGLFADRVAPGTLVCTMNRPKVGGYTLPVDWVAVVTIDQEAQWSQEMAWAERLWDWIPFRLEVDLLVPRTDPVLTQMVLAFTTDLTTSVAAPADVAKAIDLEQFTVGAQADEIDPYP